ncbi:MAG TPA: GNAT family N-acetyltransferase [Parafilimonas sp.]|nr:GNAT family N-acetyltransferase [Parafilimonas sp.]
MEILVREIHDDDAQQVMLLCKQLGYEIALNTVRRNIELLNSENDNKVFVAECRHAVVGWIGVAYVLTIQSLPFCEVRGLVVDEQFRKNHIGKLLIEKAAGWCKEKGCATLRVRCNTKRKPIHSFYRHLGFTEKKEQKIFEINV